MTYVHQSDLKDSNILKLNKRIILIWMANILVGSIIALVILFALSYSFPNDYQGISFSQVLFYAFWTLLIINILYLVWLFLEHKNFVYYFTKSGLVIKKGVIDLDRHVIPYETIQDIRVKRSVFERLLGLGSVELETAASTAATLAKYSIPSISNYRVVVNFLMKKHKQFISKNGVHKSEHETTNELLKDLIKEVKELKNVLSKK